jgi:hypothetical protein
MRGRDTFRMRLPCGESVGNARESERTLDNVARASESKAAGDEGDSAKTNLSLQAESWELSKLASPIMIVSMLQFLMVMVDMGMVCIL